MTSLISSQIVRLPSDHVPKESGRRTTQKLGFPLLKLSAQNVKEFHQLVSNKCQKNLFLLSAGTDILMRANDGFIAYVYSSNYQETSRNREVILKGGATNREKMYQVETTTRGILVVHATFLSYTDFGAFPGIMVTTSEGLVSDSSWKCIDNDEITIDSLNYWTDWLRDWPDAVEGDIQAEALIKSQHPDGFSPHAKLIWARPHPLKSETIPPKTVVCFRLPGLQYV